ncbi:recombinase family protein [Desulfofundulus sp. TPOSR]|uniref:recombinase family protein n=1 Tax=Desulfofundulus sp. TPOSR TaxID=2714340 RepID=UPI0014099962|nr:recombinase family protein [Desulfofundulus sp. TPOSR]NHM27779.1 recombinase family protein [Desulfofundulus sp. TPOSR]
MNPKITSEHLSHRAVVYIRQSSMEQVRNNLESQRRQYALRDTAYEMGWREVEIIDEDLGRSGASSHNRTGFLRLVAEVSMKEVGAVFCLEASRLARNNRDWAQLVDICSLVGTLIIDHDGVYDPRLLNDRLLLGLKGTMSEFELGLIRQRALEALKGMARRGELFTVVPAGYIRTRDNRLEKDPDLRVQQAIKLVFTKFAEYGSARQVLLWFRQEGISLPVVQYGLEGPETQWRLPVYNTVLHILQNPIYAGVYAYGRTKTVVRTVEGRAIKLRSYRVPQEEWEVFIPDHHEGYITLATYERNQKQIQENASMKGTCSRGPARKGKSLLAGLLRCRRCGRKLHVAYSGRQGNVPRYACRGAAINHGTAKCLSFGGLALDRAVEQEVLKAIKPEALRATLARQERLYSSETEHRRARELALTQAEYEAERAFRQYNATEPENRLVAAELERRWNQALEEVERLKTELKKAPQHCPDPGEFAYLLALAEDFPRVWHDPGTDKALKKRIVRTLIEEILVDVDEEQALIDVVIHWAGGYHTTLKVKKNRTGQHQHSTSREVVELVRDLAHVASDREIARILNRLKLKTGKDNTWTEGRVRTLRNYQDIPAYSPQEQARTGWLNMAQAAEYLGISPMSVRRLLSAGIIPGKQIVPYAPWIIRKEDLDTEEVKSAVSAIKAGRRSPLPEDPHQIKLDFPSM